MKSSVLHNVFINPAGRRRCNLGGLNGASLCTRPVRAPAFVPGFCFVHGVVRIPSSGRARLARVKSLGRVLCCESQQPFRLSWGLLEALESIQTL